MQVMFYDHPEVQVSICDADGTLNENGSYLYIGCSFICNYIGEKQLALNNIIPKIPEVTVKIRKTLNTEYDSVRPLSEKLDRSIEIAWDDITATRESGGSFNFNRGTGEELEPGISWTSRSAGIPFPEPSYGYQPRTFFAYEAVPFIYGPINTKLAYDINLEITGYTGASDDNGFLENRWCITHILLASSNDGTAIGVGSSMNYHTEYTDDSSDFYNGTKRIRHESETEFLSEQSVVKFGESLNIDQNGIATVKGAVYHKTQDFTDYIPITLYDGTIDFDAPCYKQESSVLFVPGMHRLAVGYPHSHVNSPVPNEWSGNSANTYILETDYTPENIYGVQRATLMKNDGSIHLYVRTFQYVSGSLVTHNWVELGGNEPQSGFKLVKLWENARKTSNFSAQTVQVDMSEYALVVIQWHFNTTATTADYFAIVKNDTHTLLTVFNSSNGNMGGRSTSLNTTSISFESANYNGSANNAYAIPYAVYGIEGSTIEDLI